MTRTPEHQNTKTPVKTLFEIDVPSDISEAMSRISEAQADAYGSLEVPLVADLIEGVGAKRVLDIGAGEGSFTIKVAKDLPDVEFLAIDHNEGLIRLANDRKKKRGPDNIEFRRSYFDENFKCADFDLIFTRYTLQHSSDPKAFIRNVYDRLNDKGLFISIDPVYDYYDSADEDPVWRQFRDRIYLVYRKMGSNPNLPKSVTKWLFDAGFGDIKVMMNMYSPLTIGPGKFKDVAVASVESIGRLYPEICDMKYLQEFVRWIEDVVKTKRIDPYITIAMVMAVKG